MQKTDPRFETRLLRSVDHLLDNPASLPHWRTVGQVLIAIGIAVLAFTFFLGESSEVSINVHFLILASLFAGVCIGAGLWVLSFTKQWPVLSKYMDRAAVKRRATAPDA